MRPEITTKRSPIILMIWFAVIEAGGLFLYFIVRLFGSAKFELYTDLLLTQFLPYDTAKVIFLFGVQFTLIVYTFLLWYYEEYKIREDSITHVRGVLRKKYASIALSGLDSISVARGVLGKIFHYGNIRIQSKEKSFELRTISHPELIIKAIYDGPMAAKFSVQHNMDKLLSSEENDRLEFKSSLRYDYRAGNVSRELERTALKTVAAFLNSKGGYLVMGVDDSRTPLGLEKDFRSLQRKDKDGFENHFTQSFNAVIGPEFRDLIKLAFISADGKDICLIETLPSHRPVYFKFDGNEHFYIRTGNITSSLKLSEMESYISSRWPAL